MSEFNLSMSRRSLLAGTAAGAVVLGFEKPGFAASDPWVQATAIANRLASPTAFPNRDFVVTTYGATPCNVTTTTAYVTSTTTGTVSTPVSGSFDNYAAFAAAINACHAAGGGRVVVPAGNWYIAGPITLLSNVNFHLTSGAQIFFDPNPANYAKYGPYDCGTNGKLVISRWQGNDCYNYSPLIYAYGQSNIGLTADDNTAILNGQAGTSYGTPEGKNTFQCWWTWKGSAGTAGWVSPSPGESTANSLNAALSATYIPATAPVTVNLIEFGTATAGSSTNYKRDSSYVPAQSEAYYPLSLRVYGVGHQLPPPMIQFHSCTNVLMQNYQVTATPFWQHNPVNCRNVVVRGVYANSNGPNNDGFDPDACNYVLIDGVTFNTGDDCIAIKAGKDNDTGYGPCQNIVIQNCTMNSGHGGVTLGSEMSGGVQNVYAQNLTFLNQYWASNPLQMGFRIKTNMNRGGFVRNFYVRNVSIPNGIQTTASFYTPLTGSPVPTKTASTSAGGILTIDCDYSPSSDNVRIRPPVVTNVNISNVTVTAPTGKTTTCYQAIVIVGPVAYDYNGLTAAPTVSPVSNLTISNCNFGTPSASTPYYLYNVSGLSLSNVTIGGAVYNTTLSA
ncbi:glycoside hydrolase family 28 protein [Telmatospirillum sp.]|uniref:glycoside hydrolase family 28 protein n=1 Tax=Telmatospirillum sp. TaxID=2079197 RepID=UPI0028499AD5|nr:glycoside hydrolase family 28 protein [Telmatospirillum sp.]MDR3439128.1 glycoside hydrolase family 28 protein [Telmatospirillum sp.]